MFIYILILLFVFIFSFIYSYAKDGYLIVIFKSLSFLVFFIPAAFRFNIGTDYINYISIYNDLLNNKKVSIEPGWIVLNKISIFINLSPHYVIIISSLLTFSLLFYTPRSKSWIVLVIYCCFLYTGSYNLIRNVLSISFVWLAYLKLLQSKSMTMFCLIGVASMIHSSALIFFPLFILMNNFRINKRQTVIVVSILLITFSIFNLPSLIMQLPFLKEFRWIAYLTSDKYSSANKINSGLGVYLRWFIMILMYLMINNNDVNKKELSAVSFLFIGLVASDLLSMQMVIFYRLNICFYITYLAVFMLVCDQKKTLIRKIAFYISFSYCIFMYIVNLMNNVNGIIPYQNIDLF